jgi:hypothetical protein
MTVKVKYLVYLILDPKISKYRLKYVFTDQEFDITNYSKEYFYKDMEDDGCVELDSDNDGSVYLLSDTIEGIEKYVDMWIECDLPDIRSILRNRTLKEILE